jgi:hypothetical protein
MVAVVEVPAGATRGDGAGSAVSWAAIFGGAVAAAAIALILTELGLGLGLGVVAPWRNAGPSAARFSIVAGIWLIVVQWIGAAIGGYVAGRLRRKWVGLHTDEVFFRDTAHGFLSWALATVVGAVLVAVSGTVGATVTVTAGAAQGTMRNAADPSRYFVDTLFRPGPTAGTAAATPPGSAATPASDPRPEAGLILAKDLSSAGMTPDDRTYLAQLVAARTGLSQPEAEKRVDDVFAQLKAAQAKALAAADAARKASAAAAIIMALALLIGAFVASAAGARGGRPRDIY